MVLTYQQWNSRVKTIETKVLKQLHFCSGMIRVKMEESILYTCDKMVFVDEYKYKQFRKICLTEDFNREPNKYLIKSKIIKQGRN